MVRPCHTNPKYTSVGWDSTHCDPPRPGGNFVTTSSSTRQFEYDLVNTQSEYDLVNTRKYR